MVARQTGINCPKPNKKFDFLLRAWWSGRKKGTSKQAFSLQFITYLEASIMLRPFFIGVGATSRLGVL